MVLRFTPLDARLQPTLSFRQGSNLFDQLE